MTYKAGGYPKLTYVDKDVTVEDVNNKVKKLTEALEAYQKANRIHNDAEAELYEKGEEALGRPIEIQDREIEDILPKEK
jgi:hypothetical protein